MASRGHGVVARRELLAAGVTADEIKRRLARGALLTAYRGVYWVGHEPPSTDARYMAAVKACGDGAVLSGRAAAYLWGLVKGTPPPPEVTAPEWRRIPGLQTRERALPDRDRASRRGIPVTTVPRTLVDLARELSLDDLARACHEAGVRYGTTPRQVRDAANGRPGAKLRAIFEGDAAVTLSRLEERFLDLLRERGLPLPRTNKPAGARRVDCRWADRRLTIELDGYRYHHSRHAWEQDRRREREARARGDDFRRYTYGDVCEHPQLMLRELELILA